MSEAVERRLEEDGTALGSIVASRSDLETSAEPEGRKCCGGVASVGVGGDAAVVSGVSSVSVTAQPGLSLDGPCTETQPALPLTITSHLDGSYLGAQTGDNCEGVEAVKQGVEVGGEGVEAVKQGVETGGEGMEAVKQGVEVGGEGVEAVKQGVEVGGEGVEAVKQGVETGGEGVEAVKQGVETGGEGVEAGGEGVEVGGEGMETGGEGVEAGGEGVEAGGEAVKQGMEAGGEGVEVGGDDLTEEEGKLWLIVSADPSDFSSWTELLQRVEQRAKPGPARKVFNGFLLRYPFCYGYWRRFAELLHKCGLTGPAKEIFERSVAAIPLSVDLWLHFISFSADTHITNDTMRSLYQRAIDSCGLDFRSDPLWCSFLDWEKCNGSAQTTLAVFDQLLATPTRNHHQHFASLSELVLATPPSELLSASEYSKLLSQVGVGQEGAGQEHVAAALREALLSARRVVYEACQKEVELRVQFEEAIKRPYFHVKPLEQSQLRTWKEYLDFEIAAGEQRRIVTLFERSVIACALYDDVWTKFATYAEGISSELAESVYSRACTIHLPHKPYLHTAWAAFTEQKGDVDQARAILNNIDSVVPGLAYVRLQRIALEVRAGCWSSAGLLFQSSIAAAHDTETQILYSSRYARLLAKVLGQFDRAEEVLCAAVGVAPLDCSLYLRLMDLQAQCSPPSAEGVERVWARVSSSALPESDRLTLALHRLQFMEEFGGTIQQVIEARQAVQRLQRVSHAGRKRSMKGEIGSAKKARTNSDPATPIEGTLTATPPAALLTQDQWPAPQQGANFQAQWSQQAQVQWGQQAAAAVPEAQAQWGQQAQAQAQAQAQWAAAYQQPWGAYFQVQGGQQASYGYQPPQYADSQQP